MRQHTAYTYLLYMNVIRQSPVINLTMLATIVAAVAVRARLAPYPAETAADTAAFLGSALGAWQIQHQTAAALIAAAVWFMAGWAIGLVVRVRELYFIRTTITIPIYGIVACGIFCPHDSLTAAVVSLLFVIAVRSYFEAFRDGYGFSQMFFGSMCLGALPLLYAPSVTLLLTMPLAVMIFKRSAREAIVALAGVMSVPLTVCYVCWGVGGGFAAPLLQTAEALATPSGYRFFGALPAVAAVLAGMLLALVLGAVLISSVNIYSMNSRARYFNFYNMCAFAIALSTLALPSSTPSAFGLIAVPTAMTIPAMLVQIKPHVANAIFAVLSLLFILHLFVG